MTIRQFNTLKLFESKRPGLSYDAALELNQNTFGSLCYRKWVDYDANSETFYMTELGREVFAHVEAYQLHRQHNTGYFGKWAQKTTRHLRAVAPRRA